MSQFKLRFETIEILLELNELFQDLSLAILRMHPQFILEGGNLGPRMIGNKLRDLGQKKLIRFPTRSPPLLFRQVKAFLWPGV